MAVAPDVTASRVHERLLATWDDATSATTTVDRTVVLGGRTVRLRFSGASFADRVLPAFAHLPDASADGVDFEVRCVDGAGFDLDGIGQLGFGDDRHRIVIDSFYRTVASYVRDHGLALVWCPDAAQVPAHAGYPLRLLLAAWAADHGLQVAHAAAVGRADGVVLLTGVGGSGKSTTALSALAAGLGYLADDYCLLGADPPEVHPLYCTAKLWPGGLERLPELAPAVRGDAGDDKRLLDLVGRFDSQLLGRSPIRVVAVPRVGETQATSWSPLSPARALAALAPTTLLSTPGSGAPALGRMRRIVEQVPAVRLDLGHDRDGVTAALEELLA